MSHATAAKLSEQIRAARGYGGVEYARQWGTASRGMYVVWPEGRAFATAAAARRALMPQRNPKPRKKVRAAKRRARAGNTRARKRAAPAKRTAPTRRAAPRRRYVARYRNGKRLEFASSSDAKAVRYARGLGAARARSVCVSCRQVAAKRKKKTRRKA